VLLATSVLLAGRPAGAATSSTTVGATVLSATSLDTSACAGSDLALGSLTSGSTSITPTDCDVSFGSSNDSAGLRISQADRRGTALTQFAPQPTLHQAAPELWGVAAKSATEAWLVGKPGRSGDPMPIVHTTDGGSTWTPQTPCGTTTQLWSADYVSGSTVVAVGNTNTVCRTVDGGTTWTRIAVTGSWRTVDMLPSGEGWIAGSNGRLSHTLDGGATWTALPIPDGTWLFSDLVAASSTNLYAITSDNATPPNIRAVTSTDGGNTWTSTLIGNTVGTAWGASVAATSPTTAMVGTSYGVFRTTDTGATWTSVASWSALCMTALDSSTVVAYYGSTSPPRRSTDGGATWTASPMFSPSTGQIRGCKAASATVAYSSGFNDQRVVTTDAGATHVVSPSAFRDQLAIAAWTGDRFVSVGSTGSVRRSIDGGTTITSPTSGSPNDLQDVEAFSTDRAVAVGVAGTVVRSVDQGATWASVPSGPAQTLNAVDRSPDGWLYAAGITGTVIRSSDDGLTWSTVAAPSVNNITDIVAVSRDVVWVVGSAGTIYRTADGGSTWTAQASGTALSLTSIDAIDGQDAVAATAVDGSQQSGTLRTTDGGATWTLTMTVGPNPNYSTQVRYLTPSTVVVASSSGYRRSTDGGVTWTTVSTGLTNGWAIAPLDSNSFLIAGQADLLARVVPATGFGDYSFGTADFSGAASVFGACLQAASGTASTLWPVAGAGNCTAANLASWRGIAVDTTGGTAKVATTATSGTGALTFRFGAKAGAGQAPGAYAADLAFEVVAPDS
jgi:photosystem II stability/assembly factor-like uncharacterized protein